LAVFHGNRDPAGRLESNSAFKRDGQARWPA
jgi:hypothetical protein